MKVMSSKYSIAITWNNEKSKLYIPVLPEKIEIKKGVSNSKIDVVELGEIIEKGTPNCSKYSWNSIFPSMTSPLVSVSNLKSPNTYVEQIEKLMNSQTPVHLIVSGTGVTDYCLITDFSYSEEGGDVGTLFYSIDLIQYKTVTVRKLTKSTAKKATTTSRTSTKSTNTSSNSNTYTVKSGDCLWSIAQAKLGDGNKWSKIWDLNATTIQNVAKKNGVSASKNNPIIFAGTVLKLPS